MSKQNGKHKEEEKKEVALTTAAGQPLIPVTLSLDYLAGDAGRGSQNVTQKDTATPMLIMLQSNSPQTKKQDGKYIDGAQPGMILNNVSNELLDGEKGFMVVPAYFEKVFIEWKPNREGFVAIHDVNTKLREQVKMTPVKQADGSMKELPLIPNGNLLVETNQHYVLIVGDNGAVEPAVIPMVSTALKCSRTWNSLIKKMTMTDSKGQMFNPASYYMVYKLNSKYRTKGNNSWFTWSVQQVGPVPNRTLYEAAKAFEAAIDAGSVRVAQTIDQSEAINGKSSEEDSEEM